MEKAQELLMEVQKLDSKIDISDKLKQIKAKEANQDKALS